jgi:probable HAF family extracellular repeat protein
MKRIASLIFGGLLLFRASTCFAQMYTVTDLGTLGGSWSIPYAINASGQVVGQSSRGDNTIHGFRTAADSPINPATDDLGTLGGTLSRADGINDFGQVVGSSCTSQCGSTNGTAHAFRTAANSAINPMTDDLGTLGGEWSEAYGINGSGQVVGRSFITNNQTGDAFRTAANGPILAETDDLGTLVGRTWSEAYAINASGQVVGSSGEISHAFRTTANKPINPASDDLGTLGGTWSYGRGINDSGQVVGASYTSGDLAIHAFRTAANSAINPFTDDLGTLGGTWSYAYDINASAQVVGSSLLVGDMYAHAFLHTGGVMHDLNDLVPTGSPLLGGATSINDAGQIASGGLVQICTSGGCQEWEHAFLLTPIYKAFVQQPINRDESSVFSAKRGVVPVKFTLNENNSATCNLLPATIAITRTAGGSLGAIDESTYVANADNGSDFRINGCQYAYNLAAYSLGVGTYRVDISINGLVIGHAVFALK